MLRNSPEGNTKQALTQVNLLPVVTLTTHDPSPHLPSWNSHQNTSKAFQSELHPVKMDGDGWRSNIDQLSRFSQKHLKWPLSTDPFTLNAFHRTHFTAGESRLLNDVSLLQREWIVRFNTFKPGRIMGSNASVADSCLLQLGQVPQILHSSHKLPGRSDG